MQNEINFANVAHTTGDAYDLLASEIEARKARVAETIFEIGLALVEAKKRLSHGQFIKFLSDGRVNYEPRTAQLLMKLANAEDGRNLAGYGIAKASLLLRLSPDKRSDLLRTRRVHELSVPRLREIVGHLLGAPHSAGGFRKKRSAGDAFHRGFQAGVKNGTKAEAKVAWAAGVLHISLSEISNAAVEAAFKELVHLFHPAKGIIKNTKFMRNLYEARKTLFTCFAKGNAA
jgi:hypothetical protein